jgi:hypothetical protein
LAVPWTFHFHGRILYPILNTYIGMLSPASGPAVLHRGDEVVNLYLISLEIQSQWSGLLTGIAFDLVRHAKNTLVLYGVSSAYDIPIYCFEDLF